MPDAVLLTPSAPVRSSGTGLRTCGVVEALARHGVVDVRYVALEGETPDPALAAHPRVRLREVVPSRGARRALAVARALRRGVPADVARGVSPELAAAARGVPAGVRVIADGPAAAAALLPVLDRRPVTYLAHSLESGFRRHVPGSSAGKELERFERMVLRTAAESWMATRADLEQARGLAGPDIPLRYVPNVVDVARIARVEPPGTGRLLFVGDFRSPPDAEARTWLLDEVMPRVWARRPATTLVLAGRGSDRAALPAERVEALGFVGDLAPVYASADAVIVPLLHGGGSPLTFVEALAHGLPVVATAHAAALLEDGAAGEHFLAGDDAAEVAAAVTRALDGRARDVGRAGRALAERAYSVDALAELLA